MALFFRILLRGVSSWWLLAPNTPRQDHRPCTRRKNSIFAPVSVSTPVDQGANQRFSPWTPSSFSPDPRCRNRIFFYPGRRNMVASGKKEQGVQRANHSVCPLPGKCRKKTGSRNFKFRRWVQGPWSCRGVLGARSHQPKTPKQDTEKQTATNPKPRSRIRKNKQPPNEREEIQRKSSFATPSFVRPAFVSGNRTEVRQPGP